MLKKIKNFLNRFFSGKMGEHEPDTPLLIIIGIIIVAGLIMLSSATSAYAYARYHSSYYFFKHQLFGLVLGLGVFWFFSKKDYHAWKKYALGFLVASILLLLLVFIPGIRGDWGTSRSWINLFGFSLQPAELVKVSFLLYLAAWLEGRGKRIHEFGEGTRPFLIAFGIIAVLMLLQPDFGTLSIIAATSFIVYYVGGGSFKHILALMLLGVLGMMIMIHFKPYQADRFKCYWDPNWSPRDVCYQVNQSLIAVGSGGFWGRGLGASRQKFMYIPEVDGDSIFPIIGEEMGFLFSSAFIILFLLLFYRGYLISKSAPDVYGKILSIGIVSWLTLQAIINIGGMIDFMPMTGVPLPFISYGGSAMMAALGAIGILVNISKHTK